MLLRDQKRFWKLCQETEDQLLESIIFKRALVLLFSYQLNRVSMIRRIKARTNFFPKKFRWARSFEFFLMKWDECIFLGPTYIVPKKFCIKSLVFCTILNETSGLAMRPITLVSVDFCFKHIAKAQSFAAVFKGVSGTNQILFGCLDISLFPSIRMHISNFEQ